MKVKTLFLYKYSDNILYFNYYSYLKQSLIHFVLNYIIDKEYKLYEKDFNWYIYY